MANFKELINSDKPVLVDFYADWCGPCQMMKPVLSQLKEKIGGKATILKVDVDKNKAASTQYKIMGIPTFILFKKGKVMWRHSGVLSLKQLEDVVAKHE